MSETTLITKATRGAIMFAMTIALVLAALVVWKTLTAGDDEQCPEPKENVLLAYGFLFAAVIAGGASGFWYLCDKTLKAQQEDQG